MSAADSATVTKPKRKYVRITLAIAAEVIRLRGLKRTYREISERTGISQGSVARVLHEPATREVAMDLVRRNGLDRQAFRESVQDFVFLRYPPDDPSGVGPREQSNRRG